MKYIVTILLISTSFFIKAQIPVDQALQKMQLYENSVYVTYGHRITLLFSELEYRNEVGIFPKTNIAFLNYLQLTVLMQDTAKQEQWKQSRYLKSRNYLRENAQGGRLILYVERYDQYNTNNKMFFVIIRDKEDNKLWEYQLPPRPADLVSSYVFSNWAIIDIDIELPEEFYVYVNNKTTEHLSDTKFLIQQNAAPLAKPEEE